MLNTPFYQWTTKMDFVRILCSTFQSGNLPVGMGESVSVYFVDYPTPEYTKLRVMDHIRVKTFKKILKII